MKNLIEKTADGYRLPGLVDAHVHVESSHLLPSEFGRVALSHGTFHAVCDPHEIVNVMGADGLKLMLEDGAKSPVSLHFMMPSAVPATPFETSGAEISAAGTEECFNRFPELFGLGEVMNISAVLARDPETMAKIRSAASRGKHVDGHFPDGTLSELMSYRAAGIRNDHEAENAENALRKIEAGIDVFIREGSAAKNLRSVLPAVNDSNSGHFSFCADDISAADLMAGGDVLRAVRLAVAAGMEPARAVELASVNPARHYGIELRADDYFIVEDLVDFHVLEVVRHGRPYHPGESRTEPASYPNTVRLPDMSRFAFPSIPAGSRINAVSVTPGSLLTGHSVLPASDAGRLVRLAVIERHGRGGKSAFGFVEGIGIIDGAVGSTVAHDSHNVLLAGSNDADMRAAALRLAEIGGGAVVVRNGVIVAEMPLPVGGLMSTAPAGVVAAQDRAVRSAVAAAGCSLPDPLTSLAFLSLSAIPELKLTDKGLFKSSCNSFIPLFE